MAKEKGSVNNNVFIPQKEFDLFKKIDEDIKKDSQLIRDIIENTKEIIKKNRHVG